MRGEWTSEAFEKARTMANELRGKIDERAGCILGAGLRAAFRETMAQELAVSEREALYGDAERGPEIPDPRDDSDIYLGKLRAEPLANFWFVRGDTDRN